MRRMYSFGGIVLDVISKRPGVIDRKAGGSILNASVSLARLKILVSFISEFGMDEAGQIIDSFLTSNGVNQSFIHRYNNGKTAIARANLDENNNAAYTFEKD